MGPVSPWLWVVMASAMAYAQVQSTDPSVPATTQAPQKPFHNSQRRNVQQTSGPVAQPTQIVGQSPSSTATQSNTNPGAPVPTVRTGQGQLPPMQPGQPGQAQGLGSGMIAPQTPSWTPSSAPTGATACQVALSPDRTTIRLIASGGSVEMRHVSLGQDRVQKVFNSLDGQWAAVVFKVRGVDQYGLVVVSLSACQPQSEIDLPGVAQEAAFDDKNVSLTFASGAKSYPLRAASIIDPSP